MTGKSLSCWKCGSPLGDMPLPLGRLSQCKACHAQLHACRMCIFFDRTVSKQCREPVAEEVKDKGRANFCGYLQPNPEAYHAADDSKARESQSQLDALFGLQADDTGHAPAGADEAKQRLDQLFGLDKK